MKRKGDILYMKMK